MSKDNEGAIWKNERREKDTHPHFTGQATINGQEFWVSAWKRGEDAKPNSPALKFSFRLKEQQTPKPIPADHGKDMDEFEDSTIPF